MASAKKPDGTVLKLLAEAIAASATTPADTAALTAVAAAFEASMMELDAALGRENGARPKFPVLAQNPRRPAAAHSPAGPIPIPYPNIGRLPQDPKRAQQSKEAALRRHVLARHKLDAEISRQLSVLSEEAGSRDANVAKTSRGLWQVKMKAAMNYQSYSFNVKFEGKGTVRALDRTTPNHR